MPDDMLAVAQAAIQQGYGQLTWYSKYYFIYTMNYGFLQLHSFDIFLIFLQESVLFFPSISSSDFVFSDNLYCLLLSFYH